MEWDQETVTHLKEHIEKWPASGSEIKQACNMMEHVPQSDRDMVMKMLPDDKMYNTPEDAIADLNKEEGMAGGEAPHQM